MEKTITIKKSRIESIRQVEAEKERRRKIKQSKRWK